MPAAPHGRTAIVAIDPGQNGGVVRLDSRGQILEARKMPPSDDALWDWLRRCCQPQVPVFLEQVTTGFPGTGKRAMAVLYGNYRALQMALCGLSVDPIIVPARRWQTALGIPPRRGMPSTAWKNLLKGEAQRHFPHHPVTLKTADALLLGVYGLRTLAHGEPRAKHPTRQTTRQEAVAPAHVTTHETTRRGARAR